jgi:tetratricopeptide (TPR) repeat protein
MDDLRLQQALQFHQQGELGSALDAYRSLLEQDRPPLAVFLNASAIWRSQNQLAEAVACLNRGIALYPGEPGPWNNLGNCHLDAGTHQQAAVAYRRALALQPVFTDARISLAACLRDLGHPNLAYATIRDGYRLTESAKERQRLLVPLVEALLALAAQNDSNVETQQLESFVTQVEAELRSELAPSDPTKAGLLMAQLWIQLGQLDRALASRYQLIEDTKAFLAQKPELTLKKSFHESWHGISWNLAIKLLKQGRLAQGWQLYEHGLQVSASGPQRWQRSLKKPFTPQQLPFWRGESLAGQRLLLLGEQGIGDAMMFATLIPRLQQEGATVALFPGDRLLQIYRRSLPDAAVLSAEDLKSGRYGPQDFDLQSPLGSICQYRFHQLSDYAPRSPFLQADAQQTARLRQRYHDGRPLIGLSWQGGGKANRIAMKSIGLKQLAPLLARSDCRFVSLQYGDDAPHLERFRKASGIDVLHDDSIDPLGDMDGWLAQVAAMDAVLSIANTTIHGAGGLGIPTLCLVSQQADWRWIEPSIHRGCYWYPSVEAAYQSDQGDWQPALDAARQWLDRRCALVPA